MDGTIGEIRMFAGNFAPKNWAFCQGQSLAVNSNTALFSILGTTYGGDGRTTFSLPDLRGRAPIGTGAGPGLTPRNLGELSGVEQNQLSVNQMPSHTHMATATATATTTMNVDSTGLANFSNPTGKFLAKGGAAAPVYDNGPADATMNAGALTTNVTVNNVTIGLAGNGLPVNNMQPYLGINYIICLIGMYPSRS